MLKVIAVTGNAGEEIFLAGSVEEQIIELLELGVNMPPGEQQVFILSYITPDHPLTAPDGGPRGG